MSLSRCTQNPTFMEEWRKGWHPEIIASKTSDRNVLVVGAGPAGLEAARALGERGYEVALAEAGTELGGRVARESLLPGLSAWGRVRDYREGQITKMPNVSVYFDSRLDAQQVLGFGFDHVAVATGSHWRDDGVGRFHTLPISVNSAMRVLTPDDLMNGDRPSGRIVIYDDDHYYMGGVLAELLRGTVNTLEQAAIQTRLIRLGVDIRVSHAIQSIHNESVDLVCTYSGNQTEVACDAVVLVTARISDDAIFHEVEGVCTERDGESIKSVQVIGDASAPAPIAWATYAGHRFARELDEKIIADAVPFRREITQLHDI